MRKIEKSNFRVEVYPRTTLYGIVVDNEEDVCKSMLNDIRRHVDSVSAAVIVYDEIPTCEFCGAAWSEKSETYNGGCCTADQKAEDHRSLKNTVFPQESNG